MTKKDTPTLHIRVSPEERALLEHAARSFKMKLSTWIRFLALQAAHGVRETRKEA